MMSPIGPYLAEFAPPACFRPSRSAPPADAAPLEDDADHAGRAESLRLEQARSEGLADGRAAAEAEHAVRLEELETRHAEHIQAERRRWFDQQGMALAASLDSGLAELERRLAEALVETLEPFLSHAVRIKLADELKQAVDSLVANGTSPAIQVLGPADLVDPVRVAFAGRGGVEVIATDTPEVKVLAGDTAIRSHLQVWASRLSLAGAVR